MTQGRFETIYNCRPDGWDDRNFWTKHRTKGLAVLRGPHEKDHMERESCPFHDLRAEGCFQPEYWGPGVMSRTIDPAHLTGRGKGGRLLRTGVWRPHKGVGCGGTLIPEDTAPGQPPKLLLRGQQDRPWTSTGAKRAAFSIPPYMTVPPAAPLVPPVEASFHTNFHVQYPYVPYEHQADEYVPATSQGRIDFRLKAGKVPFRLDPRPEIRTRTAMRDEKEEEAADPARHVHIPRDPAGDVWRLPRISPHAVHLRNAQDETATSLHVVHAYEALHARCCPVDYWPNNSRTNACAPTIMQVVTGLLSICCCFGVFVNGCIVSNIIGYCGFSFIAWSNAANSSSFWRLSKA